MSVQAPPVAPSNSSASSAKRMNQWFVAAIVFVAIACIPFGVSDVYLLNVLILTLLYAAMSQSWNILSGYCGQISLGHALYFGVGAFTTSVLFVKGGITPWAGLLAGAGIAALLALALGAISFRLKGHYFSIATLVIAEIGLLLMHNWNFVGAAEGIQWPYGPDSWVSLQFARNKLPYVYVALALCIVTWAVTWKIENSRWGFWWRAVKDDHEAAESLGVDVFSSKMAAAAISAIFTAMGGGFYAAFVGYVSPESVMEFRFSLLFALPAVLGGIGTLWGPLLGAFILIPLSELTRSYLGGTGTGADLIIYGSLIMVIALIQPEGLLSFFQSRVRSPS